MASDAGTLPVSSTGQPGLPKLQTSVVVSSATSSPTPSLSPAASNSTQPTDEEPTSDDGNRPGEGQASGPDMSSTQADDDATQGESGSARRRNRSSTVKGSNDGVARLTASEIHDLTSSPDSLPMAPAPPKWSPAPIVEDSTVKPDQSDAIRQSILKYYDLGPQEPFLPAGDVLTESGFPAGERGRQQYRSPRNMSTPPATRAERSDTFTRPLSPRRNSQPQGTRPSPLVLSFDGATIPNLAESGNGPQSRVTTPVLSFSPQPGDGAFATMGITTSSVPPSPGLSAIPLPPMSIHTHLQLELAAQRPSPLYIFQDPGAELPYESSAIKFERLKNVLLLPFYLERTLYFGALACLDAWLYNFTILPVRFVIAVGVLVRWWAYLLAKEGGWLFGYVWSGLGRLWMRGRSGRQRRLSDASNHSRSQSIASETSVDIDRQGIIRPRLGSRASSGHRVPPQHRARTPQPKTGTFRHRRTKSMPSSLSTFHKADMLQGAVILCSSIALMSLDASRMYHFVRAQSAIKLYVIYNILEVGDRLLSALGQDILECLFSTETLSRNASGRSKVLMPFGMFILALVYSCIHSIALYYQVITLNVAVNSYSNALLTLLLSNQFVEIKSTVFKRFEKDNLFQLTCADIVERFQLWIMLFIIGMRNVVEVGGLSVPGAGAGSSSIEDASQRASSILPHSFTLLPSWLRSAEVLTPFLIVVGSEMLVDTIKHAYISKFNNIKPRFYSRILDILCKDYYTNAFMMPSLIRRLGLAVIPLSCLFIRSTVQTYHMFLSTHLPMPVPVQQSTQTALSEESAVPSSLAVIAALNRFDTLIRDSLGRATYGYPYGSPLNSRPWYAWTSDDFIAALTMIVFFFIAFLVLLILKLLLGMVLLKYARNKFAEMKRQEANAAATGTTRADMKDKYEAKGRRVGGYGQVEVGEERQRWIHADPNEGLKGGKGPGLKKAAAVVSTDEKTQHPEGDYNGVYRYDMVAKRIW